uniref:Ribosomal protein L7Ae/L30e/S12e/Gadd45 domain-containing protein n=2 Tax=Cacopsylla melanoneura TaxID=428564 RepID=A0A8D8SZ97_9HEMI
MAIFTFMESSNDGKVKSLAEVNKKKVQKSFKNVLTSPHTQYWFPIQNDDLRKLKEQMEKNLPALVNLKSRIPWKYLKKLSKEERIKKLTEKKRKIKETECNQPLFSMRSFLSVGLNETSRCLSHDKLSCIVVDGGAKSKCVAIFLVNLAIARQVPVVICPELCEQTLSRFGFKTVAFGILNKVNNSADEMKKLITLQDIIVAIFTKQLSREPILCNRFKQILNEINNELKDEAMNVSEEDTKQSILDESNDDSMLDESSHEESVVSEDNVGDIYRYRTDKTYRVFVPTITSSQEPVSSKSEDFISVSSGDTLKRSSKQEMVSMKKRPKDIEDDLFFIDTGELLKPPVVKRIKPNQKRVKGKVKNS